MGIVRKTAAVIAASGLMVGLSAVTASPASADPWINHSQVLDISNPRTASSVNTSLGTVQIRYGTYQGRQYGWGRAMNVPPPSGGLYLRFEVDTDGNRIPDDSAHFNLGTDGFNWTAGYPTSSSSARAFRACVLDLFENTCSEAGSRTPWW